MTLHTITAPLTGTVEQICITPGDAVNAGDLLLLLESMKVHVRIEAERSGTIDSINVHVGDTVERSQALLMINSATTEIPNRQSSTTEHDEHPSIQDWQARRDLSLDQHRQTNVEKRHAKGYRTARENLSSLCDISTFQEYGQLAVAAQRGRIDYDTLKTSTAADGVITGIGSVNGQTTALIINDYTVLAGTQGYYHHAKIDRMLEIARQRKLPVIMFTEGGGGRPGDTDVTTINSGLQCRSFGTWASLSGHVPRIAIANGYNFAGNAALFGAADLTIATRTCWIGMAGPAMISGGGLGDFKATEIGPIEVQQSNGVVDIVADDEQHACVLASKALGYFQGTLTQWQHTEQTSLRAVLPDNRRLVYQIRDIIRTLADQDSVLEIQPEFGQAMVCAFARLEGKPVGIMANDCQILGGAIDIDAGQKAARFMRLCDQFDRPIISLCDTPGFMVGPAHEEQGAVRKLAELFTVGAQLKTPFIGVVLRKCYGLGAQAMLGGSTHRPQYTVSWPTGEFGPMGLEGAVTLGFKKELAAQADDDARQALFEQLLEEQYARGQAIEVASVLEIDAVIDPAETRAILTNCLT